MTRRLGRVRLALVVVLIIAASLVAAPASAELEHPRQHFLRGSQAGLFIHWGMRRYPGLSGFWIDNNFAATYVDGIRGSIDGTEGGGYAYGGLKPGFWNDGAHGVTTINRTDPDLHFVHVVTRPPGSTLRLRDNGYRVTGVTNFRTGSSVAFSQADGDYRTYWDSDKNLPVSLRFDLGSTKPVRYLGINQREDSVAYARSATEQLVRIRQYRVYVSANGSDWGARSPSTIKFFNNNDGANAPDLDRITAT